MVGWKCSLCKYEKKSNVTKRNVEAGSIWDSYKIANPNGSIGDKICNSCFLHIRKTVDGLTKHGVNTRTTITPIVQPMEADYVNEESSQLSNMFSDISSVSQSEYITQPSQGMSDISSQPLSFMSSQNTNIHHGIYNFNDVAVVPVLIQEEESMDIGESFYSEDMQADSSQNAFSSTGNQKIFLGKVNSCISTQSKCFICGSKSDGRVRVPKSERDRVWNEKRIRIPPDNRCCRKHFEQNKFTTNTMDNIFQHNAGTLIPAAELQEWIFSLSSQVNTKRSPVDFDSTALADDDYQTLLGISIEQFNFLISFLGTEVKNSKNRSTRNALALFLMKMRLNLSHITLQFLFNIENMSTVSETIASVTTALSSNFVPNYLGYSHISRSQIIETKSTPSFSRLLNANSDQMFLILDGTYLNIQKASNFEFQRKSYSGQKKRNLLKPMMVTTTNGYILECEGLYFSDGGNNDASILNHMLRNPESVTSIMLENDKMILDRGFRDVISQIRENGIDPHMPNLLSKHQKQFTAIQGNESRKITMMRWLVEAVNGRIMKKFKFFDAVISNSAIPKLNTYFRIACAIINCFSPPLFTESDIHETLIDTAIARATLSNILQDRIETSRLDRRRSRWVEAMADLLPTFPTLTSEDLLHITLGTYQIKMGELYTNEHMKEQSAYKIYLGRGCEEEGLLQAKIQSRFRKSHSHKLWIEFIQNGVGAEAISGWYCQCKSGARTVGTCAHVASVIWYLGYARHHPDKIHRKKNLAEGILDAAASTSEVTFDSDDSEDEADDE